MKRLTLLVVLVLSLVAVQTATPVPAGTAALEAGCCWCPSDTISCSTDVQCDSYCGTPGFGACEGFCCACSG